MGSDKTLETEKEVISDKLITLDILEKIRISKTLLSINIPNLNDAPISMILNVDDQLKSIIIDGLQSKNALTALTKNKILSVETHLRGVPVKFNTILIKSEKNKDYLSHHIKFPEQIEYFQKRKEHRVTVGIGLHITFHIRVENKWVSIGRITDISSGGLGLLISEKEKYFLNKLSQAIICKIQFDEKTSFHCKIKLCHTVYDENSGKYQMGSYFEGLTLQDVNKLSKLIRSIDRDNIRKETRQAI